MSMRDCACCKKISDMRRMRTCPTCGASVCPSCAGQSGYCLRCREDTEE